jgi:putative flippase GtrA
MNRQFIQFIAVGGFAAAVNLLSRIVLSHWMSYAQAIVIAYMLGMVTAFILNRLFVFRRSTNALHHQVFWFCVVNLAAVLQTLLVSLLLNDVAFPRMGFQWHTETIAHAVGVAIPVVTSFIGHKRLSFRENLSPMGANEKANSPDSIKK